MSDSKVYRFTGPTTAISCEVAYDEEQQRYFATGEGWTGFSSHSGQAAALNCFRGWLTDEGGYFKAMVER